MQEPVTTGRAGAAGGQKTRVLRRLDIREGPTGEGDDRNSRLAVVVDVETTSAMVEHGAVIELSIRGIRYDREGIITHIGDIHSWREDPGVRLTPDTTAITGLVDGDLAGQCIDDALAISLLRSASIVIAHNAAFDRPFVERRLEGACGLDWACSYRQVDWRVRGFDGLGLGYLLHQAGYFFEKGHRADVDVDALVQLLRHRFDDGTTVLAEILHKSSTPGWIVKAQGAGFGARSVLKARGYRWDSRRKVWWTEILDVGRTAEEFWLAANIYAAGKGARSMGPVFEPASAAERFR